MAKSKSKTKRTKIQPIEDEEDLQVKGGGDKTEVDPDAEDIAVDADAEVTELADEDAEAEDAAIDADSEITELAGDEDSVALEDEAAEEADKFAFDEGEEEQVKADDDEEEEQVKGKGKDDEDEDDDEDSYDEGPPAPPAKISKLAIFFILMNWIAAPAFLTFAYLDHTKRAEYSYRTLVNYVQIWGLPLKSEEDATSISIETRPYINLTMEQLDKAFRDRPGTDKTLIKKDRVEFAPFEETAEKRLPFRLRPSDLTLGVRKDLFEGVGDPVQTLEEEIERLKTALPDEIDKAAKEARNALPSKDEEKRAYVRKSYVPFSWDTEHNNAKKKEIDDAAGKDLDTLVQRAAIRNVLLSFTHDVWAIRKLNEELESKTGAKLDEMLLESLQKRMYYDLLAPINIYRPGDISDPKNYKIEMLATYSLEKVKEFAQQRLSAAIADQYDIDVHVGPVWEKNATEHGMKRDSVEKRRKISFILFALSQVNIPTLDKKLYPKGVERAQVICGLYEFTNASMHYIRTQRVLEERIVESIRTDRDGPIAQDKDAKVQQLTASAGFSVEYENEIKRLAILVGKIDDAQARLKDLEGQRDQFQKTFVQRAAQHQEALDKLLKARQTTAKEIERLKDLQKDLHEALVELSEAGERNEKLYYEIRDLTLRYQAEEDRLNALQKTKGKKRP